MADQLDFGFPIASRLANTKRWQVHELAYFAGFIDGEGSITVFDFVGKQQINPASCLRLSAYNTNRAVLEWIAFRFSGRVYVGKRRRLENKQSYVWEKSGRQAAEILKACLPFLKVKKQQAELFIEVAATIGNGLKGRGRSLPTHVVDFRRAAAMKMSTLNGGCHASIGSHEKSKHSEKS